MTLGKLGAWALVEEDSITKVWTLFLRRRGIKYDQWALLALLVWGESHGLGVTEGAILGLKTWEQPG